MFFFFFIFRLFFFFVCALVCPPTSTSKLFRVVYNSNAIKQTSESIDRMLDFFSRYRFNIKLPLWGFDSIFGLSDRQKKKKKNENSIILLTLLDYFKQTINYFRFDQKNNTEGAMKNWKKKQKWKNEIIFGSDLRLNWNPDVQHLWPEQRSKKRNKTKQQK